MFFTLTKNLPKNLTTYDFLKTFAVITMIIDHIGMYLYPEQSEFRAIGRLSMPVWLFLVGYAQTRDLSPLLWIGGFILVASNVILGGYIFSLNILFTILFVRFSLDAIVKVFLRSKESMVFVSLAIIVLIFPTFVIFDYGTHALLFAMLGYFVRHKEKLGLSNSFVLIFMGLGVVIHATGEQVSFALTELGGIILAVGLFLVCFYMTSFKPKEYPKLTASLPRIFTGVIRLMGRHSLEIYVVHLLILKAFAFYLFPESYGWFQPKWF